MGLKIFSFCLDTEVVDRIDKISDARSEFVRSRPFVTNTAFAHFGTNGGKRPFAAGAKAAGLTLIVDVQNNIKCLHWLLVAAGPRFLNSYSQTYITYINPLVAAGPRFLNSYSRRSGH